MRSVWSRAGSCSEGAKAEVALAKKLNIPVGTLKETLLFLGAEIKKETTQDLEEETVIVKDMRRSSVHRLDPGGDLGMPNTKTKGSRRGHSARTKPMSNYSYIESFSGPAGRAP